MSLTIQEAVRIEDSLKSSFSDVIMKDQNRHIIILAKNHNGHISPRPCEHKLTMISKNVSTGIDAQGYLCSSKEPMKYDWIVHCICGKVKSSELHDDEFVSNIPAFKKVGNDFVFSEME